MKALAKLALLLTLTCTTIGNITYCSDSRGGTFTCTRIGNIVRCYQVPHVIYDADGNRVRVKSERTRRLAILNTARDAVQAKLNKLAKTISALTTATTTTPNVPEYHAALASARTRHDREAALMHQLEWAISNLQIDRAVTPQERYRWAQQKRSRNFNAEPDAEAPTPDSALEKTQTLANGPSLSPADTTPERA